MKFERMIWIVGSNDSEKNIMLDRKRGFEVIERSNKMSEMNEKKNKKKKNEKNVSTDCYCGFKAIEMSAESEKVCVEAGIEELFLAIEEVELSDRFGLSDLSGGPFAKEKKSWNVSALNGGWTLVNENVAVVFLKTFVGSVCGCIDDSCESSVNGGSCNDLKMFEGEIGAGTDDLMKFEGEIGASTGDLGAGTVTLQYDWCVGARTGHLNLVRLVGSTDSLVGHVGSTDGLGACVGGTDDVVGHVGSTDSLVGRVGSTDGRVEFVGSTDDFVGRVGSTDGLVTCVGSTDDVVGHVGSTDSLVGRIGSTMDLSVYVGSTDEKKLKKFAVKDSGIESKQGEPVSTSESILSDISSEEGVGMCHSGTRESAKSCSIGDVLDHVRVTI